MYVCMCVCMYVCMYVCICMYMYVCVYVYICHDHLFSQTVRLEKAMNKGFFFPLQLLYATCEDLQISLNTIYSDN